MSYIKELKLLGEKVMQHTFGLKTYICFGLL